VGILGTAITFGAGYFAGMKIGRKPIDVGRSAAEDVRTRALDLASRARPALNRTMPGMTGELVDVRSVREVMTPAPESVTPETTVSEAASKMELADIGNVLVVDDTGHIQGILTDRDIAIRAAAKGMDPRSTPVREIFTPVVQTIEPETTVREAIETMRRHDIRRLPVVEGNRPIGIVSLGDLSMSQRAGTALADISFAPPDK
jgi:CBS domain-containing protein